MSGGGVTLEDFEVTVSEHNLSNYIFRTNYLEYDYYVRGESPGNALPFIQFNIVPIPNYAKCDRIEYSIQDLTRSQITEAGKLQCSTTTGDSGTLIVMINGISKTVRINILAD